MQWLVYLLLAVSCVTTGCTNMYSGAGQLAEANDHQRFVFLSSTRIYGTLPVRAKLISL